MILLGKYGLVDCFKHLLQYTLQYTESTKERTAYTFLSSQFMALQINYLDKNIFQVDMEFSTSFCGLLFL